MASISTVVTMGYGSFGSVNLLPTLGYGIGEEVEPPASTARATRSYIVQGARTRVENVSGANRIAGIVSGANTREANVNG